MGVDIGSTGCKAMVFMQDGKILSHAYEEYEKISPIEIDSIVLKKAVFLVIGKAADCGVQVDAICISSFGESFVMLDGTDRPLDNILTYTNLCGQKQCAEMVQKHGEMRFRKIAGMRPLSMYSLAKMAAYHETGLLDQAKKVMQMGEYIAYLLTGEHAVDYSLASRTMAFDVVNKRWDDELLSYAGAERSLMGSPVQSGVVIGKLRPATAKELSLSSNCVVVAGGQDQVCAATGAGVLSPGLAIDGIGTVECITPCFTSPMLRNDFLDNNYVCVPYTIPDCYATYIFNFTGGSLLKWYRDTFTAGIAEQVAQNGSNFYAYMDSIGARQPTDLLVVPHFAGNATPDMNPDAKGLIWGLSFDTDNATLYRALLEGVTFEMMYNLEIVTGMGVAINELRATGGGSKSPYWLQIKADMTGLPITALNVEEAGITGCVMLAGVTTGVYSDLNEAAKVLVKIREVYEPNSVHKQVYAEKFERFKKLRQYSGPIS